MERQATKNILAQSPNGIVYKCASCSKFHFEFNNLIFAFSLEEYKNFRRYFLTLDADYWEAQNSDMINRRKIIVPVGHQNLQIAFCKDEILELKSLFSSKVEHEHRFNRSLNRTLVKELCNN